MRMRQTRIPIGIMMCLLVTHIFVFVISPLESRGSLIPPVPSDDSATSLSISGRERAEDLRTVQRVLEAKIVQQRLRDLGLSPEEINTRLHRLSDAQLHQVAAQVNSLIPGGIESELNLILTVLLIILVAVVIVILI